MNQKVFISYSWTTPEHEEWVISLAERLMADGIDVVIDKWGLKEGHDLYDFMESMVNSPEINKVLIILDKKYTDKANTRSGGVGTETQIISPKIYKNVAQEKFIPIVRERDDKGTAFIPTYLDGRFYIDFSSNEQFEANYESLIRNIYDRPSYSKPKLGKPPSYLFEETPMNFKTTHILRSFDKQIDNHPERINYFLRDFLESFLSNLRDFRIEFKTQNQIDIGKLICENIIQYTPLRDDFINFFDKLTKHTIVFDFDIIIRFLENLTQLTAPENNRGNWSEFEFDNYRFIINELFIYLIAIGLKNENYKFIEDLLYSSYFPKDKLNYKNEVKDYGAFYFHIDIIRPYYNSTYSQNFFSPMADLMIKRLPEFISITNYVHADLLCYYIGCLINVSWFPKTYIYDTSSNFEMFYKLISLRHFEKVKILFDVSSPSELKEKLIKQRENSKDLHRMGYSASFHSVRPIHEAIDIESIGTKK